MVKIKTKKELKEALKTREPKIVVSGDLAAQIRKKTKVRKASKIGGAALVIAGIIAIPFTAGTSLGGVILGTTALTVGTLTISTAELAILCGTALGIAGILKGAKVTFNPDGSVTIEPTYSK